MVANAAGSLKDAVADAADAVVEYVDPLAKDDKLRQRLVAAIAAGAAARRRAQKHTGLRGLAVRLGTDPVLRAQLAETVLQLQGAQKRAKKAHSHKLRNATLFLSSIGIAAAAVPAAREAVTSRLRGLRNPASSTNSWDSASINKTSIDEEIEVAVAVNAAYNQWTQFEEFPRFMDGIEEVRQLDDTLLHWVATVGGKRAEWDAKIVDQEPDQRITWESTDGKRTSGSVSFEEAGAGRTRIRLHMSYTPEGAEMIGSAIGLDDRRVRGDLERFRDLIEGRQIETGAWRGTIRDGDEIGKTDTA